MYVCSSWFGGNIVHLEFFSGVFVTLGAIRLIRVVSCLDEHEMFFFLLFILKLVEKTYPKFLSSRYGGEPQRVVVLLPHILYS